MLDHDLLSRFTTHLKEALQKSLAFALNNGRSLIEPGDLFVGLLQETGCIASEFLTKAGARREIAEALFAGRSEVHTNGQAIAPDLTRASRLLLEHAVMTAREYEHRYIGTEHLLFAVLAKPDQRLREFFEQEQLSYDQLREQVIDLLKSTTKFPEMTSRSNEEESGQEAERPEQTEQKRTVSGKLPRKALDVFARHLTDRDTANTLDPVIGRDDELERVIEILCRRTKNNPVLLGEPGVGKTAIVEGLASRLSTGAVPDVLQGKRVYAIDLALMVAGTMYRGEFEARLKQLVEEVKGDANIILFIDEIHTIVGAGSTSGSLDAANILKPALARGEIRCIGATTWAEYKKHLEPDAALDRRFQPVDVREPSSEATLAMLEGLRERYEQHHRVTFAPGTIELTVQLAERYLTDRFFPDKAIDILDEAGAHVATRLRSEKDIAKLRKIDEQLSTVQREKEAALEANDLKTAAKAARDEEKLLKEKAKANQSLQSTREAAKLVVEASDILHIVGRLARIPENILSSSEEATLAELHTRLGSQIFGQEKAVQAVADIVRRARLGLVHPRRPRGSWLFVGPSGTGKTALARELAVQLFGKEDALIRFDMSEFSEGHSVSKLLGSPAGYVGYREQNKLGDAIRKRPHAVVLFDEFEKAHPDVQHLLLQILEDGLLQDSTGKPLSFRQTYIVLTSNAGSDLLKKTAVGFGSDRAQESLSESLVHEHLRERFRPELLNRLDRIVVFQPLTESTLHSIATRELKELFERLKAQRGTTSTVAKQVIDWLLTHAAKQKDEGARAVRRAIEREIEQLLVQAILKQPKKKTLRLTMQKTGPVVK